MTRLFNSSSSTSNNIVGHQSPDQMEVNLPATASKRRSSMKHAGRINWPRSKSKCGTCQQGLWHWDGRMARPDILMHITRVLPHTDIVIDSPGIENIVASLKEDELEEWKSAVQNGVEKGDWTDLVWILGLSDSWIAFNRNHSQTQETTSAEWILGSSDQPTYVLCFYLALIPTPNHMPS